MRYAILAAALTMSATVFLACPPSPSPPAPSPPDAAPDDGGADDAPDDGRRSACATTCKHLAAVGCDAGADSLCASACAKAEAAHVVAFPHKCLDAAQTKEAVRACGAVACP